MHELSIVIEIFDLLGEIAKEQQLSEISSVTVEVGELCGVLPEYFSECWRAARIGSEYESTELKLITVPAAALCSCGREYEMTSNGRVCPYCGKTDYTVIRGRQFFVKEIEAR